LGDADSATFVVGEDGIIEARFIDPDYRKRMAIEDLLKALKNAQSQGGRDKSRRRSSDRGCSWQAADGMEKGR